MYTKLAETSYARHTAMVSEGLQKSGKELELAKPATGLKNELTVTVRFEPNRLSEECLASAYELALPLVEHDTTGKRMNKKSRGKTDAPKERLVM